MFIKIVLFSVLVLVSTEQIRYDDYVLYRVTSQNEEGLKYLQHLYQTPRDLKFWITPTRIGEDVSVISPPGMRKELEDTFTAKNIIFEVIDENIQKEIDADKNNTEHIIGRIYWDDYQDIESVFNYFEELAETHSNIVSIFKAGTTFQGRDIPGIRISRGNSGRVFILEGGQLGADWLSPAVVSFIADQLIQGDDPEALAASQDFEWHIIPFMNPDGFEYSQNVDRLWVKNRRIDRLNPTGVDLSRNWNSHWGIHGGSFYNNTNNYIGLGPFSEVETRSVSAYISSLGPRIAGLLSFRTFGQRLLIPFAQSFDDIDELLYNYNDMITIGRRAMGSLAVKYNTQYLVGTSSAVSDGSTGNIGDWVKYRFNPPVVATYLLRGFTTHVLPDSNVLPSCLETYDSVMAIIREAKFINVL